MKRSWLLFLLTALLVTATAIPYGASAEGDNASSLQLQDVQVALFINSGKNPSLVSSVSLSAPGGLAVNGIASGGASFPWFQAPAEQGELRFDIDGYRVFVAETGDPAKAESLLASLQRAKQPGAVYEHQSKGKPMYRVYAGPFGTRSQAEAVLAALAGNADLVKLAGDASGISLAGPYYASAGTYASEAEAAARAGALWDAGVYAAIALTKNDAGETRYSVWFGEAKDEAQLQNAIADSGRKLPGLTAAPANVSSPYLILRRDRPGPTSLSSAIRRYSLGGTAHTVAVGANYASKGVKVKERSGRTYRGTMELSRYNNALAVVNRVPLEAYVTSVVGSELDAAWPAEALKAQAVASRTYVRKQGLKYAIAHVSDTTADQAYYGVEREFPTIQQAVLATEGEILLGPQGTVLDAFYHSNSGNMTADPVEVWGQPLAGLSSVPSLDTFAERGKLIWYRVVFGTGTGTSSGKVGYVRSDYVRLTGETNDAGLPLGTATDSGVNVRPAPYVNNETNAPLGQLSTGEKVTIIREDMESTSYQWIRGPITADRLLLLMASSGVSSQLLSGMSSIHELEVISRGAATGRVTGMAADGKLLPVDRPEQYRNLLSMPSTRFEVEETAKVTVLGAGGKRTSLPSSSGTAALTAAGAGGRKVPLTGDGYFITSGDGTARYATMDPQFRFIGLGYGHGLGMSQWGAFGLAQLGYDYRKILQYYYKDATLVKG